MKETGPGGKLILQAFLFTVLIPGVVAVALPFLISLRFGTSLELGKWRIIGLPFLGVGILLYLVSLASFLVQGRGTPAIWFARIFRSIIGEEPVALVRSSIYLWTRNPMYLGVVLMIFGQALWFDDLSYHLYALVIWAIFHAVVIGIEEPHLKKKFGKPYEEYCRETPRWLGRSTEADEPTGEEKSK